MANNPRKFSEKIALLNQKQQECNVEFEKILQEVSGAIKVSDFLILMSSKAPTLFGILNTRPSMRHTSGRRRKMLVCQLLMCHSLKKR